MADLILKQFLVRFVASGKLTTIVVPVRPQDVVGGAEWHLRGHPEKEIRSEAIDRYVRRAVTMFTEKYIGPGCDIQVKARSQGDWQCYRIK
jgi:hypothetical protein